ncbi:hypothetical protein F5146DRAFT_1205269 [Armillaria mellea]|nr:hypothetical protein F5146DRAFT_1205269 [Armillaria mellea]
MAPTYTESATTQSVSFLQFRIQYASIALLYYDYVLTLPAEVKYIWGSKFRLSTILYLCCRYALVANVLYLLAIAGQLGARLRYVVQNHCGPERYWARCRYCKNANTAAIDARPGPQMHWVNKWSHAGFSQRLLNALTLPLSGLLTARFLLQLRAWEHKQSALMTGSDSRRTVSNVLPPIEFRVLSVIDEFGEDPVSVAERRQSEG